MAETIYNAPGYLFSIDSHIAEPVLTPEEPLPPLVGLDFMKVLDEFPAIPSYQPSIYQLDDFPEQDMDMPWTKPIISKRSSIISVSHMVIIDLDEDFVTHHGPAVPVLSEQIGYDDPETSFLSFLDDEEDAFYDLAVFAAEFGPEGVIEANSDVDSN